MPYNIIEVEQLQQLTVRVLADAVPAGLGLVVPPAYLYTQTVDNQHSVLVKGANLLMAGSTDRLLVLNDLDRSNRGYPGAEVWIKELAGIGIPPAACRSVDCNQLLNTLTESLALVEFAKRERLSHLMIIAPPFHILRAFVSVVSAIKKLGDIDLRIYCQIGVSQPWGQTVRHSQGTLVATRTGLILTELARLRLYYQKGDLVNVQTALEYLYWRDNW